ncbi:MAG: hypothetical protein KDA57_13630 [Planctomycetales bacterium]|nr:hypothetical protein [Planctomycetales bacterium]
MSGIIPLPNTRVSNLLLRQRLTQQYQADQLDLFRLQEQISTGQRITLPSDDAPAALRSIALQRLIERKSQLETNIQGGISYLSATDEAISQVANKLADLKGATLGVAGTIVSQEERDAVISDVNSFLESLISTANRQFRGRYLFAGSQTGQKPYSFDGDSVAYHGNAESIRNYSDLGVLFASNASGQDVFGGISAAVEGITDLNPQLDIDTRLSSLRGGRGITSDGAITISDGTNNSTIDLSNARTIGDIVRLIEENPPASQNVEVTVTGSGLTVAFASGNNIIINEVGNGTTARELGILETAGALSITGDDLDPIILKTTVLDDLLGTKARALIQSGADGDNADILLEANANGAALNGVTVQFVDDSLLNAGPGLTAGNEVVAYDANARAAKAAITFAGNNNDLILEANAAGVSFNNVRVDVTSTASGGVPTASYNASSKVLTINLESDGTSDANQVIAAIAGLAGNPFTATLDTSVETGNDGSGAIAVVTQTDFANTGNSGGDSKTLYINIDPGESNANQVIAAINAEGTFSAQLDPKDTAEVSEAGTGKVNLNGPTATSSGGSGTSLDQSSGIRVVNGGQTYDITFEDAETVEDLLNILNNSEAGLLAEINAKATGINVRSRLSGQDFQIGEVNGGSTATQLGIRTFTEDTKLGSLNYGTGVPTKIDNNLSITLSDLQITASNGSSFNVDLSGAATPTAVRDAINLAAATATVSVSAQLDTSGNGIVLVDNTQGFAGLTVAQSGANLPITGGIDFELPSDDFAITASTGDIFRIDVSSASGTGNPTIGDILTAINSATGGAVTAQLADSGNGIELVDAGGGSLTVTQLDGSQAAQYLGLVEQGSTQNTSTGDTLTGTDTNFLETDSVFTTLIRLRDALQSGDITQIERAVAKVENDIDRVTFARAEVGARWRGLELSHQSLQAEEIQLRSALSDEIDVDLVEAISQLTARQVSLEASLRSSAQILQLSLLNYI